MANQLTPQKIRNIGVYGVVRQAEVDDVLVPEGAVTEAVNFHFDRKGVATVRPGITALGGTVQAGVPCIGLFNAQNSTILASFNGGGSSSIFMYNGVTYDKTLGGGTSSVKVRFVDFANRTILPNFIGNTLTSMYVWNGSGSAGWTYTGNPINPQQMWGYNPQFIEVYKSRIYLAGDTSYPSRLLFSAVISSSGNLSWNPTTDWVDINPGDGEDCTGLKRYSLELLFFKPNYIYRFKTSGVDPDPLIKIGTRSQESVVEGKKGLYFHHDTGFYVYTGNYPTEISRPISDIVSAIPYSKFSSIVSWNDSDHIYWSVGNLTITDVNTSSTWTNVVLRYTESSEVWTVYSFSNEPKRGSNFNNGSTLSRVIGTDNGLVSTFNSGTTDMGEPIKYRLITKWYEVEGISTKKSITKLVAIAEKSQETELMYQIDDIPEWYTILQLRKYMTYFNGQSKTFHRIRFKVTGVSRVESAVFQGIEILNGINEGIVE